jgi:hypothetical protein
MPKLIYHDSDGIDKAVVLGAEPILIGRATECQVQTQDAMVSRRHARIIWDGAYIIEDLGSSNGVYIGHEKVQRAQIRPGDVVTCGSLVLKLMPDTTGRMTAEQRAQVQAASGAPPMAPPPMAPPPMAPPPMAPPPMAPPPMAPPAMAPPAAAPQFSTTRGMPPPMAPPPPSASMPVGPNAILRGATTGPVNLPDPQTTAELQSERRRRTETEEALLRAEERARAAEARATELETSARDADKLKRRVDQLTSDLRRLRGGQDPEPAPSDTFDEASGERAKRVAAEAEVERLKLRISGLESELARAGAAAPSGGDSGEAARLKRQVDQLTSELRRVRGGAPADSGADAARIAELTAELRRAEAERDQARAATARPPSSASTGAPGAADAAAALSDALAELRSSLRAATDEAGLLTAPAESVQVVADALRAASEQLEGARDRLRELSKTLGAS